MTDERLHHAKVEFEGRDLSARAVLTFIAALVVVCVVMYFILWGLYDFLDHYSRTHQRPTNPLVHATNRDLRTPTTQDTEKFPLPRLEPSERTELNKQRVEEEETLHTYGWMDEKAGTAHIPIERAMALLVQRGLPMAPEEPTKNLTNEHSPKNQAAAKPGNTRIGQTGKEP